MASPQNPLTARVIVNRIWQKHFGRGIVATLDNFGKMGEHADASGAARLAGGRVHEPRLEHQADAPADDDVGGLPDGVGVRGRGQSREGSGEPYLWRFRPQRLDAEIVRDSMLAVGGNINLAIGGRPIFPLIAEGDLLAEARPRHLEKHRRTDRTSWRRSVYVYRARSLPFPMFETFDLPDRTSPPAARNVSTVPTQALTLLNNAFVLRQAELFADRVKREAGSDPAQADRSRVSDRADAAADAGGAGDRTWRRARPQSLVDFTHVLLNLNEFVYIR